MNFLTDAYEFLKSPAGGMVWAALFVLSELIGANPWMKSSTVGGFLGGALKTLYRLVTGKTAPDVQPATQVAGQIVGIATVAPLGIFGTISVAVQTIKQAMDLAAKITNAVKQYNLDQWMNDLEQTTTKLENAKTAEEKMNAARELARLTRRLS
jgi:hypothetical protein